MTRVVAATAAHLLLVLAGCGEPPKTASADEDATRIVTLAPHLAELVFEVGAGDKIVGVSAYSDYPDAARSIRIVSDAFTVDQEQLALLTPDLVLAWESGTPGQIIDELRAAGYRVAVIRSRGLDDIAAALVEVGRLAGREMQARQVATRFEQELNELRAEFATRATVSVFYQVSARPLYTIGGQHYISGILELCGGRNVFAELDELAPSVTAEAVVDRNPDVILAGSADGDAAFAEWRRWTHLRVNQLQAFYSVDSDQIGRPSLRVAAAAAAVCEQLHAVRTKAAAPRLESTADSR